MSNASDNAVYERADAQVVIGTSALSFEPLCKLNDSHSQKDLQHIDFALLCITIALLCITFSYAANQRCHTYCYIVIDSATQDYIRVSLSGGILSDNGGIIGMTGTDYQRTDSCSTPDIPMIYSYCSSLSYLPNHQYHSDVLQNIARYVPGHS